MNILKKGAIASTLFASLLPIAHANISGTVYTDFNLNGTNDPTDTPVSGVIINAVCEDGSTASATTSTLGTYTITVATAGDNCRLEVDTSTLGYLVGAGANAGGDDTLVGIVSDSATHNISLASPVTYCQANPDTAMTAFPSSVHPWDPVPVSAPSTYGSLFTLPHPDVATNEINNDHTIRRQKAIASDTGAIWGLAWAKNTKQLYSAANLRRYALLKTNSEAGAGAIYKTDNSDNTQTGATLFSTVPNVGYTLAVRDLSFPPGGDDDNAVKPSVGREGLGDLDISEDETKLYTINLGTKELVTIDAITGAIITSVLIPNPYGVDCLDADVRPWAIKVKGVDIYVGSVCETQIEAGVGAVVQKYDGSSFTLTARTNSLLFLRPAAIDPAVNAPTAAYQWSNWSDVAIFNTEHSPILSDIEFDNNGDLILGYIDRSAHTRITGYSSGDIRRMCLNPADGTYTDESSDVLATSCGSHISNYGNHAGYPNPLNFHEFYRGEIWGGLNGHPEAAQGALAMAPGSANVLITAMDPTAWTQPGGFSLLNNITGDKEAAQSLIPGGFGIEETTVYGQKTGGMGDIEYLCDPAPIEIGNYVWSDLNGDGVQDPNEPPLTAVEVKLFNAAGTEIDTTTTDPQGHYYFSGVTPNTNYEIRIALSAVSNLPTTLADANTNTEDQHDSDATDDGTTATIALTTGNPGQNEHALDFGFGTPPPAPVVSLGSVVWNDTNNNGTQDDGEAGIAGANVTLFDSAGAQVGATIPTLSNGEYLFTNLPEGDYTVQVDISSVVGGFVPSTTQVANPENNDENDSNIATTTGSVHTSGTITLSDGSEPTGAAELSGLNSAMGAGDAVDDGDDDNGNMTVDFGFVSTTVQIGDLVWIEDDNNGDPADGTITFPPAGTVVTATAPDGVTTYTGTTDVNGNYLIDVPKNDTYTVTVATPTNHVPTLGSSDNSVPDTTSENNNPHDGEGGTTVVVGTEDNLTLDFGFTPSVKIGSLVWVETDGDGDSTNGTPTPIPGATVTATSDTTGQIFTMVTNASGIYSIDVPMNATYTITITPPLGFVPTANLGGGNIPNNNTSTDNQSHLDGVKVTVTTIDNLAVDFGFMNAPPTEIPVSPRWMMFMLMLGLFLFAFRSGVLRRS